MNITNLTYLPSADPINILEVCASFENKFFIIFSIFAFFFLLKLYVFPWASKKAKRLELEAYTILFEHADVYIDYILTFVLITLWYLLSPLAG